MVLFGRVKFYENAFSGLLNSKSFINFIHVYNKSTTNDVKSSYVARNDIIQIKKMKLWPCKIRSQVPQRIGTGTGYQVKKGWN
jgi:long-subunit fatty acid transport protein